MDGGMQGHEGGREVQTERLPPAPRVHLSGPRYHFHLLSTLRLAIPHNHLPTQKSVVVVVVVVYLLYIHHPGLRNDHWVLWNTASENFLVKCFSTLGPWTSIGP